MPGRLGQEREILLASGDHLGDEKVVNLEAEPFRSPGVLVTDDDEPLLPALREESCVFGDAMGVVAEGLMERRQLADAAFDDVCALGMVPGKEIGLGGDAHGRRSV